MNFDEVKDSGQRQEFGTGSVRDTQTGKGRYDLLPPRAMRRLAKHFENGAVKYGDRNWEKGQPLGRYLDSTLRHVFAILEGRDEEDHAAAAAWNMMAFIETAERIEAGELPATLDTTDYLKVQAATDKGTKDNPFGSDELAWWEVEQLYIGEPLYWENEYGDVSRFDPEGRDGRGNRWAYIEGSQVE